MGHLVNSDAFHLCFLDILKTVDNLSLNNKVNLNPELASLLYCEAAIIHATLDVGFGFQGFND